MRTVFCSSCFGVRPYQCSTIELSRIIPFSFSLVFPAALPLLCLIRMIPLQILLQGPLMYLQNCIQETSNLLYLSISAFPLLLGHALDRLVAVSSIHYCTSTSALSTSSSSRGLTTFVGISHLEGGFTLRCLQRLSRPGLATLPWPW